MSDYNFAAQFQQNPQPALGNIVKREWLQFYKQSEKPKQFEQIIQSWDTANKETELANYSVCTTWGLHNKRMYLIDVLRRKLNFPDLKRAVLSQNELYGPSIILIEDKASGTSLIQELQSNGMSKVQAAPVTNGDKVMRLLAQTAKIEGRFMILPEEASWLDTYITELISFPSGKNDDQVDSTVFALEWLSIKRSNYGWTRESLDALERISGNSVYDQLMNRMGRFGW